jgi:hypothetical protein
LNEYKGPSEKEDEPDLAKKLEWLASAAVQVVEDLHDHQTSTDQVLNSMSFLFMRIHELVIRR